MDGGVNWDRTDQFVGVLRRMEGHFEGRTEE